MVYAAEADMFKCFQNLFHQHNIAKYVIIFIRLLQRLSCSWQHPQIIASWLIPSCQGFQQSPFCTECSWLTIWQPKEKTIQAFAQSLGFLFYGIGISETRFFITCTCHSALAMPQNHTQFKWGVDSHPTPVEVREKAQISVTLCAFSPILHLSCCFVVFTFIYFF